MNRTVHRFSSLARTISSRQLHSVAAPSSSSLLSHAVRRSAPRVLSSASVSRPPALPFLHSPFSRFISTPPGDKSGLVSSQPAPSGEGTIPVVLVQDAKQMWEEFDAVVDVREANEVAEGMIPGALHIPLGEVLSNPQQAQLQDKKQVLVYCRAGIRSAKAVEALQGAGIHSVNLGGGYLAWQGDRK